MSKIDPQKFSARLEALVREAEALGAAPDLKAALTAALDAWRRSEESGSTAEAMSRWNEEKYRLLVENSLNCIAVIQDDRIVFGNSRVGTIAGIDLESIKSIPFLEVIHPEDRGILQELMRRDAAGEKVAEPFEVRAFGPGGEVVWVDGSATSIEWEGRPAYLVFYIDVTERKMAEEALRRHHEQLEELVRERTEELEKTVALLQAEIREKERAEKVIIKHRKRLERLGVELTLTEERERRRIAMDLHDHIGQSLAVSRLKLKTARASLMTDEASAYLDEVLALVEGMVLETRSLTHELSPPILADLGLIPALEWLVERTWKEYGLTGRFIYGRVAEPEDREFRVILFRCTRELLMNVVKHAKAGRVDVNVRSDDGFLFIEVRDDGVGVEVPSLFDKAGQNGGFGLFSIRERLHSVGGELEVESEPGRGFLAILKTPLHARVDSGTVRDG